MNFGNNSIGKEYNRIGNWISNKILSEPDSFILGASIDELVEYYFSNNYFSPIEIDNDRKETVEIKKEWKIIPAHKRDGPFKNMGDLRFECSSIILAIPIVAFPDRDDCEKELAFIYMRLQPDKPSNGLTELKIQSAKKTSPNKQEVEEYLNLFEYLLEAVMYKIQKQTQKSYDTLFDTFTLEELALMRF